MEDDYDAIPVEAAKRSITPYIAGAVNLNKEPIRIFYKLSRGWDLFEHPSKAKDNVGNLRERTKKDCSIDGDKLQSSLDLQELGILDAVRKFLAPPPAHLRCKLTKLSVYTTGDDPPAFRSKADNLVATVLVLVPLGFKGGSLHIESGDFECQHEWRINGDLNWVAIRKGCGFQVGEVSKGSCVMLTYHLTLAAAPPKVVKDVSATLSEYLAEQARAVEHEIVLGFPCKNLYHKALVEPCSEDCLSKMLQGADAVVYHAAAAVPNVKAKIARIWQCAEEEEAAEIYVDRKFTGFELSSYVYNRKDIHRVDEMIANGDNPRAVEKDENIYWASSKHLWLTGGAHLYRDKQDDGIEEGVSSVKCAVAILVTLTPKIKKKRQRPLVEEEEEDDEEKSVAEKKQKSDQSGDSGDESRNPKIQEP